MKQIVILMVGLMLAFTPQQANAQFFKKALKVLGDVASGMVSSGTSSGSYHSPVGIDGKVRVPAIVFSNPSAVTNYTQSEGSLGLEAPDQRIQYSFYDNNSEFSTSYAGATLSFQKNSANTNFVTLYDVSTYKYDIELPSTVEWKGQTWKISVIGPQAFQSKTINSIDFPRTVYRIGYNAFLGAKLPKEFRIPSSIKKIDAHAFAECKNLTTVYIPASVMDIGYAPFYNCYDLEKIVVDENNPYYKSVDGILYNKEMTEIIQFPCAKQMVKYTAPKTLVSVNREAFSNTLNLFTVVLPEGVQYLSVGAFSKSYIHDLYLPATIRNIGNAALDVNEWNDGGGHTQKTNIIVASSSPLNAHAGAFTSFGSYFLSQPNVYVDKGTRSKYISTDPWSKLENVVEAEFIRK
ncbi:MAG: leucine-rich repeat domain-containing protein [Prevotella sp.]|nr:leucine-rich repeat domain-containing protein [Prevotella sp.]